MHNLYKFEDVNCSMEANSLFHRLVVLAQCLDDVASYFDYELTPYPTSLFKDGFVRKPNKAALYKDLCKDKICASVPCNVTFVVDAGCLLHRVTWQRGSSVSDIIQLYLNYVTHRFSASAVIVFDGYNKGPEIKDHEHLRRSGKVSRVAPDVVIQLRRQIAFEKGVFGKRAKQAAVHKSPSRLLRDIGHFSC
jgi:hypothetical protein